MKRAKIDLIKNSSVLSAQEISIIRKTALCVLTTMRADGVLEICPLKASEMRALNRTYRKHDEVTNILSFSGEGPSAIFGEKQKIGEIYFSPEQIRRDARGKVYGEDPYPILLQKLIIHSVLHCFGYTHRKKDDRIKMERKEKKIFLTIHATYRYRP